MRAGHVQARLTLAQVADWTMAQLDELDRGDGLDYTPQEAQDAVRAWAWLLGVGTSGPAFDAARVEVLNDGAVFAALHRPVGEWLNWWRCLAWDDFGSNGYGRDDCGGWAWAVLDRGRALGAGLGEFAGQVSVAQAVRRLNPE